MASINRTLDSPPLVIEIPDSPLTPEEPRAPEPRNPSLDAPLASVIPYHGYDSARKLELHRILDAFQLSEDHGVYVCQLFRDSRRTRIDDYWHEVEDHASGVCELRRMVGRHDTPLLPAARGKLAKFAATLRQLSDRLDAALGSRGTV